MCDCKTVSLAWTGQWMKWSLFLVISASRFFSSPSFPPQDPWSLHSSSCPHQSLNSANSLTFEIHLYDFKSPSWNDLNLTHYLSQGELQLELFLTLVWEALHPAKGASGPIVLSRDIFSHELNLLSLFLPVNRTTLSTAILVVNGWHRRRPLP